MMRAASVVKRFGDGAPVATMFRAIYARILSDEAIDRVFQENAKRQVSSEILLSYLVNLMASVVTTSHPSVSAAHQRSKLDVSRQALYDKLKGVEPEVAQALVSHTAGQLSSLLLQQRVQHDDVIPGYHSFVIDGKTYNSTEHRLAESRTDSRRPLPGRAIAILDTRYELFTAIQCDMNAHRCERKILEPLLAQLKKGAVYIADRNFSDSLILEAFTKAEAYFVIRKHGACPSVREIPGAKRRDYKQPTIAGGRVSERDVEIRLKSGDWIALRLITVKLASPTRKGDTQIHIFSNLNKSVSGVTIASAYRSRWKIETCLGYLAQALNAEIKTLCYPPAAGLAFSIALILFNVMSSLKTIMQRRAKQPNPEKPIEISYYYLFLEVEGHHQSMELLIEPCYWKRFEQMTLAQFSKWLTSIASRANLAMYRKHTRQPKKPPPKRRFNGSRHIATIKLLNARE